MVKKETYLEKKATKLLVLGPERKMCFIIGIFTVAALKHLGIIANCLKPWIIYCVQKIHAMNFFDLEFFSKTNK